MWDGKDEPERVFPVQVESIEAFLPNESHRFVEGQRGEIVVFRFEHDLWDNKNKYDGTRIIKIGTWHGMIRTTNELTEGKQKERERQKGTDLIHPILLHGLNRLSNKRASYISEKKKKKQGPHQRWFSHNLRYTVRTKKRAEAWTNLYPAFSISCLR